MELWVRVFRDRAAGLDGDEWTLELNDSIEPGRTQRGWNQYIRNSYAQFRCSLCRRSWPSKQVQVLFHFSRESSLRRGTVRVRRFKQKCRRCSAARMEEPSFTVENIDVMVEKLMEKIRIRCYGEEPPESNRNLRFDGRIEGPHERLHCEACLKGICSQSPAQ
ncbi:receptor-transporting protein 3-like [Colossoma macropomum]|uniref:receptor-transporting protein 3-like n=1 Tax=Colossoma macropomum TaxID=42526 RepID=UPI001863F433|nr:receptor-transporting protein 3-like [Colossoma macropomum]